MSNSEIVMAMDDMLSFKKNAERENANPTGLTVDQVEMSSGPAFIEHLIKYRREKFHSQTDRFEVMCSDPIARFTCSRWFKEITGKPFKSYDINVEGNPDEIMTDIWERWEQLNMNEILRAIGEKWAGDGYCIGDLYISRSGNPGYHVFGFFESPPEYWKRYNMKGSEFHNVIYEYYVQYLPIPSGWEYEVNYNVHAEEYWLYPTMPGFFHFTRDRWNYGVGRSRIQGIWASLTKLRKISHADFRRKLVFNVFEYPDDWDAEKGLEEMIEAFRRADEVEGVAYPKRINPQSGEVEDWPKFFDRTADMQGASPGGDASAGGSLLRNPEYARVLIDLGYTETKFVGNQPGAVEGSKLDYNENDEVDMREFGLFKPVIKWILTWLFENGLLEGCDPESLNYVAMGNYDVKCHIEWEVLENRMRESEMNAEMMEQDAESKASKQNALADMILRECLRLNINSPGMIPVQSSWVQQMGVKGKNLVFKFKDWPGYAGYQLPSNEMAYQKFLEASEGAEGSTGGWIWDNVWAAGVKPFSKGPRQQRSPFQNEWIRYTKDPFAGIGAEREFDEAAWEAASQELVHGTPGLLGTGGTRQPHYLTSQITGPTTQPLTQPNVTQATSPWSTSQSYTEPSWGYQASEKAISGHVKRGKGRPRARGASTSRTPVVPVNYTYPVNSAIDSLSYKKANHLYEQINKQGLSSKTWIKFKHFVDFLEKTNNPRFNSIMDEGNPMSFDIALRYTANNATGFVEEWVCKRDWKKILPHDGELVMYPDLKHGGQFEIVGTYNYYYDEQKDSPMITRQIDDTKIRNLLKGWGKENCSVMTRLNKGLPLSMSTEYRCGIMEHKGKRYQVNFHNDNFEPYLNRIAIVEHGNCDEPFCKFEVK